MEKYLEYYNQRRVSADEAVRHIKSGDRVVYGHAAAQPSLLHDAMLRRAGELRNVEVVHGFALGKLDYARPEYAESFVPHSIFANPLVREALWEGRGEFTAVHMSELDRLFVERLKADVLLTQVTPPDADGNVSMGVSCDYTRTVLDTAAIVIAQVNASMPWTGGDTVVPVGEIDWFVEQDGDLPIIPEVAEITEVERAIAMNIASLINDGDTIQAGVGAIPDTVLAMLEGHKDLGIHTELGSTAIMKLMRKGVVTNRKKSLDTGVAVCTLMGGTKEFYEFVDRNPDFVMRRCRYVNSPLTIARQKNMVAINAALQVDLFGQVCADMIGPKQYSGVGGQLDFLRGAALAEGGRSIVCMPSTAGKGKFSRVVGSLDAGAAVTDPRYDVDYVVTEHGIAELWGKSNSQRARELVAIAHPDFRGDLDRYFFEHIKKAR